MQIRTMLNRAGLAKVFFSLCSGHFPSSQNKASGVGHMRVSFSRDPFSDAV